MHPTLTDAEVTELIKKLPPIAGSVGRNFPPWRMSNEDLVQWGWVGILKFIPPPNKTPLDLLRLRLRAARTEMVDAVRAFSDPRSGTVRRRMEFLVDDFDHLADTVLAVEGPENAILHEQDVRRNMVKLTPRDKFVLHERLRGVTSRSLAARLRMNESRISQISTRIVEKLQEAA